ncbi:hypothetical protein [Comamonas testosteroni]|uniref:hypothetical protein n=1 Tax=Comamonas testosteroni TaxID=285 RepID=UPI000A86B84D|nr:hypothetical protein [Comamonas testosteroni]
MEKNNQDMNTGFGGVNWRQAPARARWWAVNKDGQAYWYCEPDVASSTDFWFSEKVAAPTFGYAGEYEASLTPRPV